MIRKLLIAFSLLFLLLLASILAIPVIFKADLLQKLQNELNKQLNAEIEFSDASLSLISDFPNLHLTIYDINIQGKNQFSDIKLFSANEIKLSIGLFSFLGDGNITILSLEFIRPDVFARVLENGSANWDIFYEDVEEEESINEENEIDESVYSIREFVMQQGNLVYQDDEGEIYFEMQDFNLSMFFAMQTERMDINLNLLSPSVSFSLENMPYLNRVKLEYQSGMKLNLEEFRFDFFQNEASLNEFPLKLDGWIAMPDDAIDMNLKLFSPASDIKPLLSLIPAAYQDDFHQIRTAGKMRFEFNAEGRYLDDQLPKFELNLMVMDGFIQYPDLPQAINNLAINLNISNPGGLADLTQIDLQKLSMNLGKNPIEASLKIKHPESNPDLEANLKASINFDDFKNIMPLEAQAISGSLNSNLEIRGNMNDWEANRYENLYANGKFTLLNFSYHDEELPDPLLIREANLSLNTKELLLEKLDLIIGKNNLQVSARLNHFVPWFVTENVDLLGQVSLNSTYLNIDELMAEDASSETVSDTASTEFIEVPANLNLNLKASIGQLVYDGMNIEQFLGEIELKDKQLKMKNLTFNIFEGSIRMNGFYETPNEREAMMDLGLNIDQISIQAAANQFNTIERIAPILAYADGKIGSQLNLSAKLDKNMDIDLNSINSKGRLSSKDIRIKDSELFRQIAEISQTSALAEPQLKNIRIGYSIKDGNLLVEPFELDMLNTKLEYSGNHYLAGTIDSRLLVPVDAKEALALLPALANTPLALLSDAKIPLYVHLRGEMSRPNLSFSLKDTPASVQEIVKQEIEEKVAAKIDEAKEALQEQARKILEQAEKRKMEVVSKAAQAGDKLVAEAEKQAKEIEKKAEGKSLLEKQLAKKAADEVRKKAKEQAQNLNREAQKQGDEIMNKARKEVEKLS